MAGHPQSLKHLQALCRGSYLSVVTRFIFLSLQCCGSTILSAQPIHSDSLNHALAASDDLNKKADILHKLASDAWDYNFDRGLHYAEEAYQIAKRGSYRKGMAI